MNVDHGYPSSVFQPEVTTTDYKNNADLTPSFRQTCPGGVSHARYLAGEAGCDVDPSLTR
jgi:hypothetical protein